VIAIDGHRQKAAEFLKNMIPGEAPSDPETVHMIADLAIGAKAKPRHERTADDYRALIADALVKNDWPAVKRRAVTLAYLFEKDLDEDSLAATMFARAYALHQMDENIEAEKQFAAIVERFGQSPRPNLRNLTKMALNHWGNILLNIAKSKQGEAFDTFYVQAADKFNAAREINPNDYSGLISCANALSEQAQAKQGDAADALFVLAEEKFALALSIKPDDHEFGWGNLLFHRARNRQGAVNRPGIAGGPNS